MLKLKIKVRDDFDNETQKFVIEYVDVELEHSLASLSKWEEIWEIPLLSTNDKTDEQNLSYLVCMCLTPNVAPEVFEKLDAEQQNQLSEYIDRKACATWFNNDPSQPKMIEALTAELIYYWISGYEIDWQVQYWHLNKLLTLIRVHDVKADNKATQQKPRARQSDVAKMNAQRRKELGSNG